MNKCLINKFLFPALIFFFLTASATAEMKQLSEEKMSCINAGSGLIVFFDTRVLINAGTVAFSDTDSDPANWIRLNDFTVDDGTGQGFKVSTLDSEPFILDVGTMPDGRTILQVNLTPFSNPISIHAQELEFCTQAIGSIDLNNILLSPSSLLRFSHHITDGTSGVEFDAGIALDIDSLEYTYNTLSDQFSMAGIHLAGSATGLPEDPLTWEMDGLFKIGDLTALPAAIDVGTDEIGQTKVVMSLPMSGSIRIEDVSLGGNSFGPIVIDDINAHRLSVSFGP